MAAPNGGDDDLSVHIYVDIEQAIAALDTILESSTTFEQKIRDIQELVKKTSKDLDESFGSIAATFKATEQEITASTNLVTAAFANLKKEASGQTNISAVPFAKDAKDIEKALADAQKSFEAFRKEQGKAFEATPFAEQAKQISTALESAQKAFDAYKASRDRLVEPTPFAEQAKQIGAAVASADKDFTKFAQSQEKLRLEQQKLAETQALKQWFEGVMAGATTTEQRINALASAIRQLAETRGISYNEASKILGGFDSVFAGTNKVQTLSGAMRQLSVETSGFGSILNSLGTVGQFVFGSVLGISALSVLQSIIRYFTEATDAALKFNQAQIALEIGVRAQQRIGVDVTVQQYRDMIEQLQMQYPILSKEQLTEGISNIAILTRDLKLTNEQFQELVKVSANASILLGRDFGETATGIAKSLSSGWFEAAQRAGFLISRQRVVDEGLRMNIENAKHGYNAMTEYERAYASLNVYIDENRSVQEDVAAIMDVQAGKVKVASAAWENLRLAVGQIFSVGWANFADSVVPVLDALSRIANIFVAFSAFIAALDSTLHTFFETWQTVWRSMGETPINVFKSLAATIRNLDWRTVLNDAFGKELKFRGLEDMLGDTGKDAGLALGEGLKDGMDTSVQDAFTKLTYDIIDEATKLKNRIEQLWLDLTRKIADIQADAARERIAADAKYEKDVENAKIEANNRQIDAANKYRIGELNAEAKFQEQLRQLRDRFLFDLEDALRERDARQVLRLTRQYQMDKNTAIREEEIAAKERERAYREELRQLAVQQAEKLRILDENHAAELEKIRANEAQKIADAQLRYEQEKADAQKAAEDRLKQQVTDFQREYNLTESQAKTLVALLDSYFGQNGPVAKIYKNLIQYILYLAAIARTGLAALGGFATQVPNQIPGAGTITPPSTHAAGGTFIARKPTLTIYGDAGPEMATFTPLNKLGQHEQAVNTGIADLTGTRQSPSGALKLMLTLSPDLRVDIINDTLYEVSATIDEVNRSR